MSAGVSTYFVFPVSAVLMRLVADLVAPANPLDDI